MAAAWMAPAPSDAAPTTASQPSAPSAARAWVGWSCSRRCSRSTTMATVGPPSRARRVYVADGPGSPGLAGPFVASRTPDEGDESDSYAGRAGGDEHVAGDRAVDAVDEARRRPAAGTARPAAVDQLHQPRPRQRPTVPRQGHAPARAEQVAPHREGARRAAPRVRGRAHPVAGASRAARRRAGRRRAGRSSEPCGGRGPRRLSSCTTSMTRCVAASFDRAVGDRDAVGGRRPALAKASPARRCA